MCHLEHVLYACGHFDNKARIATPCGCEQKAKCYIDPLKTIYIQCGNSEINGMAKSPEICNLCNSTLADRRPSASRTLSWNKNYDVDAIQRLAADDLSQNSPPEHVTRNSSFDSDVPSIFSRNSSISTASSTSTDPSIMFERKP
jgi:hypothetical protein